MLPMIYRHYPSLSMALQVPYVDEGLGAVIFTADGDMRQALNNLQATYYGFGTVTPEHVFKVCQSLC